MHLPFTPNHVQLIAACYPPSAALLTSGPDYRPNSQELSRLTYYAVNRPEKLNKLGNELEKRVRADCRRAQAGNIRARASLLISLSIVRALATECRRDISLLSSSLLSSVNVTISTLTSDLEVLARAATVFTSWTTFTDGHLIGVDNGLTRDYMLALQRFSGFSSIESKSQDSEIRNRTRLIGLAALTGAVASEALYNASSHFAPQVTIIIPALLVTLQQVEISTLDTVAASLKDKPSSPYLGEFRSRPANERRAASIHVHVDGDKGPSAEDVTDACLRVLSTVFGHASGAQVGHIMQALFDSLDDMAGWEKTDHCRWLAQRSADWTQYQYRYAVPTRLVERLLEVQDMPTTVPLHRTLTAMITTVFTSPTPLVNLSTSDIISNLITLVLRRVAIDPEDALLSSLVECISSLGMHVYYADQIQDLAAELISRLTVVEISGVIGGQKSDKEKCRSQALRCLLAGLLGLIRAADIHDLSDTPGSPESLKDHTKPGSTRPRAASKSSNVGPGEAGHIHDRSSRRTKVSPEIWQDTLTLLCDRNYAIREDYAYATLSYLENEIPKRGDSTDADGVRRVRPLAEGSIRQASSASVVLAGDGASRFLNALHAYLYVLATSSSLGVNTSPSASSAAQSTNGDLSSANPRSDSGDAYTEESPPHSQGQARRSIVFLPRQRKISAAQHLIERTPSRLSSSASANASDYGHILSILSAVHEQLPVRALLTGVPMLLALETASQVDDDGDDMLKSRQRAIKEIIAKVWMVIARVWDCPEIVVVADKAMASFQTSRLPSITLDTKARTDLLSHTPEPIMFPSMHSASPEQPLPSIDAEAALTCLASSRNALEATGLDRKSLLRRLASHWTPESALKESVEKPSNYDALRGESILKIAPALMHIENLSLQSLGRFTRGVGVTDLREALEGRSSMTNPTLPNKAPSFSTFDHTPSIGEVSTAKVVRSRTQKRAQTGGPNEVRNVLNGLGVGKQNGSSLLKSSFPPLQKTETRSSIIAPPYTT